MNTRQLRLFVTAALLVAVPLVAGCARRRPPEPAPAPPSETAPTPAPVPTPPAPTEAPAPTGTTVTESDFRPVFFDLDQSALTESARAALDHNARVLRENAAARVEIEGHCDERGTVEYNQALGQRRAEAARDYLAAQGVSADRMTVISYGKERPFAEGHDESAWAQNRRAHFRVR